MKLIIGNILCAIGYLILLWYTFFNVKRKIILICNIIISFIFGVAYLFFDAISGAFSCSFGIVMYSLFSFKDKNKFFSGPYVPIICAICYIVINIITWEGLITLLPLFATLTCVLSMWLDKEFYIKTFNIPISIFWIIYNIFCNAYTGLVGQSLLLIMDFVYLYMYFTKYKKKGTSN